ncbi:hypothetical protein WU86_07700, partial [Corynebacterium xerosis]
MARPFVARRPFLDGPAARGFTTLIAPRILPAKVVPACIPPARIGAADIVAAVAPAVRPGLVEADLPAAAAIAGVAVGLAEVAGITGIAGARPRRGSCRWSPPGGGISWWRRARGSSRRVIRQSGRHPGAATGAGGGPLLHHALLGTGSSRRGDWRPAAARCSIMRC